MLPRGAATICLWALVCALPAALGCTKVDPCQGERCKRVARREDAAVALLTIDSSIRSVTQADAACARQSIRAEPGKRRPVDVIFVIDNSGSMTEEIAAVRRNIDRDFASIIEDSGVDYRVIMLSLFGEGGTEVCIDPPLAGAGCDKGLGSTNGERYFHYNQEIGSNDALCQILDTLDRPQAPRAPHGFQDWLRPGAAKAFVLVTDDSARCTYRDDQIQLLVGADGADPFEDALAFHAALKAKSPGLFGGHYQFFSIVGLAADPKDPQPLFPFQALDTSTCSTAPTPGLSYQALSIATDALRYPVCEGRSFDAVFQVIARSVIQTAAAECTFQLPSAPGAKQLDLGSVNLELKENPDAEGQRLDQVKDGSECKDDHSFYIHDRIELCPNACRLLQQASQPVVNILYGCGFDLK